MITGRDIIPQPGEDLRSWADTLTAILNLENEDVAVATTGGGLALPILDTTGRPIVTDQGVYAYAAAGTTVVSPNLVVIDTAELANNAVIAAKVAASAITTAKLANFAVDNSKIAANAIAAANILNDAVTTQKILDAAIIGAKISTGAIASTHIQNAAIGNAHIAAAAIDAAHIQAAAITTAHIQNAAITNALIAAAAINTANIQNAAITTALIGSLAVTDAKIADLTVNKLTSGVINAATVTLSTGNGILNSGQTSFDTGVGFWLDGLGRLSLGNSGGNKLTWDGSLLNLAGNVTIQGGSGIGNLSDAGALALANDVLWSTQVTGAGKPADNADVTAANTAAGFVGQTAFATLTQITAANISTFIDVAAIGKAYIADLDAGVINSGILKGRDFQTSGSHLVIASLAADAVVTVRDISDFPVAGNGFFLNTAGAVTAFSWTGQGVNTLTGCVGVPVAPVGTIVIGSKGVAIRADTAELRYFDDFGTGTLQLVASLGTDSSADKTNLSLQNPLNLATVANISAGGDDAVGLNIDATGLRGKALVLSGAEPLAISTIGVQPESTHLSLQPALTLFQPPASAKVGTSGGFLVTASGQLYYKRLNGSSPTRSWAEIGTPGTYVCFDSTGVNGLKTIIESRGITSVTQISPGVYDVLLVDALQLGFTGFSMAGIPGGGARIITEDTDFRTASNIRLVIRTIAGATVGDCTRVSFHCLGITP